MIKSRPFYPSAMVGSALGQVGGVLLTEKNRAAGLDVGLSAGLARCRRPGAVHDPGTWSWIWR